MRFEPNSSPYSSTPPPPPPRAPLARDSAARARLVVVVPGSEALARQAVGELAHKRLARGSRSRSSGSPARASSTAIPREMRQQLTMLPVRPMPALQCTNIGRLLSSSATSMNRSTSSNEGAPCPSPEMNHLQTLVTELADARAAAHRPRPLVISVLEPQIHHGLEPAADHPRPALRRGLPAAVKRHGGARFPRRTPRRPGRKRRQARRPRRRQGAPSGSWGWRSARARPWRACAGGTRPATPSAEARVCAAR